MSGTFSELGADVAVVGARRLVRAVIFAALVGCALGTGVRVMAQTPPTVTAGGSVTSSGGITIQNPVLTADQANIFAGFAVLAFALGWIAGQQR